ncbi:MAG TPA: UDP-N-acetylmuramoyl-L-alanyl-D-glutamate--2,6-diaminopimelate ligase [Symbiobacteriaceae bacterium]|jgi:UDP-N-acetylmuramyl-tripeptide synthetase|nr:UDP-N-acetylmuramoyl-L-alanyl-D-glutamate--2,6-diaminopimelate ligase [Symbiobacteriaceae bacterium]
MRLRECLGLGRLLQGDPDTVITRVVYDSRRAEPGALFVAVPGFKADGHTFIDDAAARGAAGVVVEQPVEAPPGMAVLQVESSRQALAALSARLYRWPSRKLRVIGVTGTNGKTTTTHLIRYILQEAGHKVGLLGTVHNFIGDQELPASLTTPQASDLQELLARMVDAGCSHVVMEVSSEGLDMHRVDDVEFDIGVFTNLTQDHLNYHGTIENYREAKMQLFRSLGRGGAKHPKAAVLNIDDPSSGYFESVCTVPVIGYGLTPQAPVSAGEPECYPKGTRFQLRTPAGELDLSLKLAGRFNVYNALAAATVGMVEGLDLATIGRALEKAVGVAGRMEAVDAGQAYGVFVDYAHSPDGLENVLRTAQGFAHRRLIVVFGCGGDRDRSKRPQMGRIAAELADYTIITSDNPRSEDPEAIVRDIEQGVAEVAPPGHFYEIIVDRASAIEKAVATAEPGDVVIIAGKGHETYQIFKDRTIAFDDRLVARRSIEERMA